MHLSQLGEKFIVFRR